MSYRSSTLFSPMFVSSQGMYALMVGCSADEFFLPPPSTLSLCLLPPVQIRVFKLGFAEVSISSSTFTNFCC
ncbi:hypothetical protein ABFX02_05G097700 [Erythranthe guttata]